ncbi:hypothetical protein F4553_002222 [Allocatelliglobosispora scoriae]|uniref:Uncharacterized protein n=1 Tax=Allocatelliglobosispora scoriae TaxID=643052 RepID=A0A841BPG9_9ACTN|nr:hypothetical protein [Allocatelliglobosispora scoriae]MBB5868843.1 hypothetical protein [Allocatelliglobosispora scoriae]
MKLKLALVSLVAAAATVLVAPTAALAAPDSLACSAAGSYSRVILGTPTTYWLVGSVGNYRYWHVVSPTTPETYLRSYVVLCSGSTISWSADLAVTSTSGDRCGTTSSLLAQYVGSHNNVIGGVTYAFRYWHMKRFVSSGTIFYLVYDHSELARCVV